jgi:hypothetical protein
MFVYLYEYKKKGGKVTFPFISNLIVILHDETQKSTLA